MTRAFVSLDALLGLFDLPAHAVQAFDPAHPQFTAARPLLVLPDQFQSARAVLARRLPADHRASFVRAARVATTAVSTLPADADAWLVDAAPAESDLASIEGLRRVMERLFGPDGCPWDREQSHESLRKYLLEEVYEAVDAIDRGDLDGLREELGDVLAHIFMQTALAQQSGAFTAEDVAASAATKMVRRHPHVFGDEVAGSHDALLQRWDELKAEERADRGEPAPEDHFASVPLAAPALTRAQDLLGRAQRAAEVGAPSAEVALAELRGAVAALPEAVTSEHLGAVLWAVVVLARASNRDAEEALRHFTNGFVERRRASSGGPSAQ